MKDYLSGIISILASFQLLFVALFLFMHKKGNRNQVLHLINDGFFFLYGPLLNLYLRGVVYADPKVTILEIMYEAGFNFKAPELIGPLSGIRSIPRLIILIFV